MHSSSTIFMQYITYSPLPRKHIWNYTNVIDLRESWGNHMYSDNQKTYMVKSWFLQARSSEMCEWFQLFQWDIFVFFKIFVRSSSNSKPA